MTQLEYYDCLRGHLTGRKKTGVTGLDSYATSVLARTILAVLSKTYQVRLSWFDWGYDREELLSGFGAANVARLHRVLERKFLHRKFGCPVIVIAYFIFVRHLTRNLQELTPEGRRELDDKAEKLRDQLVMPRLLRIWQIHRRLRREEPVHPKILAAEFEVAEDTIKEDVAIMCDGLGLTVMWSAKEKSYYYGLPCLRLPPVMIRAGDVYALKMSLRTRAAPARGTPAERVATAGLQQVRERLGDHVWVSLATLDEELTGKAEPPPESPGRN